MPLAFAFHDQAQQDEIAKDAIDGIKDFLVNGGRLSPKHGSFFGRVSEQTNPSTQDVFLLSQLWLNIKREGAAYTGRGDAPLWLMGRRGFKLTAEGGIHYQAPFSEIQFTCRSLVTPGGGLDFDTLVEHVERAEENARVLNSHGLLEHANPQGEFLAEMPPARRSQALFHNDLSIIKEWPWAAEFICKAEPNDEIPYVASLTPEGNNSVVLAFHFVENNGVSRIVGFERYGSDNAVRAVRINHAFAGSTNFAEGVDPATVENAMGGCTNEIFFGSQVTSDAMNDLTAAMAELARSDGIDGSDFVNERNRQPDLLFGNMFCLDMRRGVGHLQLYDETDKISSTNAPAWLTQEDRIENMILADEMIDRFNKVNLPCNFVLRNSMPEDLVQTKLPHPDEVLMSSRQDVRDLHMHAWITSAAIAAYGKQDEIGRPVLILRHQYNREDIYLTLDPVGAHRVGVHYTKEDAIQFCEQDLGFTKLSGNVHLSEVQHWIPSSGSPNPCECVAQINEAIKGSDMIYDVMR